MGQVTFVVRQRLTHQRHRDRFESWIAEQKARLLREIPELADVRRYHFEKDELYFYTFYDFRPDVSWNERTRAATQAIRAAWRDFGPDMREFTAVPYEETWRRVADGATSSAAEHPLTIERLSFDPASPDQERAWTEWQQNEMLPDQLARLPLASITRYRALTGEPRYLLGVQEYLDADRMHSSIEQAEKPKSSGPAAPTPFWAGWARFMPYVDDLTRWIILPDRT